MQPVGRGPDTPPSEGSHDSQLMDSALVLRDSEHEDRTKESSQSSPKIPEPQEAKTGAYTGSGVIFRQSTNERPMPLSSSDAARLNCETAPRATSISALDVRIFIPSLAG